MVGLYRDAGAIDPSETLIGWYVPAPGNPGRTSPHRYTPQQFNRVVRLAADAGFAVRQVQKILADQPTNEPNRHCLALRVMTRSEKAAHRAARRTGATA